jgi:hypothetical protein
MPHPNSPNPEEQFSAEQQAILTVERCVDATYNAAICAARIAGLGIEDVPRFCASAACRVLEKLIESYQAKADEIGSGFVAPDDVEREREEMQPELRRRQREIHAAAQDLELVLNEALVMAGQIRGSIEGSIPKQ